MSLLMWLMLVFLIVCAVLGAILVIALVRLGRELRQMGDDTASLLSQASRLVKTTQLLVPVVLAMRKKGWAAIKKRNNLTRK